MPYNFASKVADEKEKNGMCGNGVGIRSSPQTTWNNAETGIVRDKADKECRKRGLDGIEPTEQAGRRKKAEMPLYGGFCFADHNCNRQVICYLEKIRFNEWEGRFEQYYGVESETDPALVIVFIRLWNSLRMQKKKYAGPVKVYDGQYYVEYSVARNRINKRFYWDSNENVLLYTLREAVFQQ